MKKKHSRENLRIAMLGHKRIPSREGGIEIVVEELATRMAKKSHSVTCYNRKGHNVAGSEFDGTKLKTYKGVTLQELLNNYLLHVLLGIIVGIGIPIIGMNIIKNCKILLFIFYPSSTVMCIRKNKSY